MSGQLRVDEITNEAGTGAPSFPNGITPSSLGTGTPGSGNFLRGDGSWQPVDVSGEIALFASGAPGQPRLVGQAVSAFPGTYPVLTVTASDAHSVNLGLGTTLQNVYSNSTTFIPGVTHVINKYTGTIRFRGETFGENVTAQSFVEMRILKNGVVLQTYNRSFQFSGLVLVFGPIDVNVVPGDTITWEYRSGSNQNFHRIRIGDNTATNGYKVIDVTGPAVVV